VTRQYPDHIDIVHLHAREASAAARLRSSRLLFPNPIPEFTAESVSFLKGNRAPARLEGVMPSKPQHYVIEMDMVGGRGGTRTRGPLLAKQA